MVILLLFFEQNNAHITQLFKTSVKTLMGYSRKWKKDRQHNDQLIKG